MYILFLILWFIFNGRVTTELLIFGLVMAAVASYFATKVMGYTAKTDLMILRNLPLAILYILNLILEIVKATLAVMSVIFTPGKKPEPIIVEFYSGFKSDFCNVLLANSITLTPGTYTIIQDKDHFVVHCLRPEYAEGMEESSFVHLLRRIK